MTDNEAGPLLTEVQRLVGASRFRSALGVLRRVSDECTGPLGGVLASFNAGALLWGELGDGDEARRYFRRTVERAAAAGPGAPDTVARLRANACEDLMLLSLSFDEYEDWARQLTELEPTNDILRGQVPVIRQLREEGHPWSDALSIIATSYYNRNDPSKDRGRYGPGLSTYRLLLNHRKELRLSREDWGVAVFEVGALAMRLTSDRMLAATRTGGDLDEFWFVAADVVPLVEEYVTANPADATNSEMLTRLRSFVGNREAIREEIASAHLPPPPPAMLSRMRPGRPGLGPEEPVPPPGAVLVVGLVMLGGLGAGIGGVVDWLAGTEKGVWIGLAIGAGLAVMTALAAVQMKLAGLGSQCVQCGRPFREAPPRPAWMPGGGVLIEMEALRAGREGAGRRCRHCGRVVCSFCDHSAPCPCGAGRYEGIHLVYS